MTSKQDQMSIFGWSNGAGGTHWYRIAEPLRGLGILGHEVRTGPVLDAQVLEVTDTVLVHMLNEAHGSEAWEKLARNGSHRLIIDVDDDVWNFDPRTDSHRMWTDERLLRLQNNIAMADVVTTPSDHLAEVLTELNPNVHVLHNYVPEWLLQYRPVKPHRFALGFQGARQHSIDLQGIGHDLWSFLSRHRRARVHLYGELNPLGLPHGRVIRTPWQADVPAYYRSLSMSVGLGPLEDIPFNYGKSAVRAVEYAALGIPAMLTDVPAYRPYVDSGWNGWLIPPGKPWIGHLEWAYKNQNQVAEMGAVARRAAAEWTTEKNAYRWEVAYHG